MISERDHAASAGAADGHRGDGHLGDTFAVATISALIIASLALSAAWIFRAAPAPEAVARRTIYPPEVFAPERGETAGYLAALAGLFVATPLVALGVARRPPRWRGALSASGLLLLTATALRVVPAAGILLDRAPLRLALALLMGALLVAAGSRLAPRRFHAPLAACGVLLAMAVGLGTVLDESFVTSRDVTWGWTYHFNAFFSAVAQAAAGRTLLVDLVDTYGLYPHALEPLARLTRGSLLPMTLFLSALTAAGMASLLALLLAALRRSWLALLAFGSIAYWLAYHWRFFLWAPDAPETWDPYFQGFPLRVLFPQIGLLLLWRRLRRPRPGPAWGLAAWSTAAILWNPDSGVATFGALGAGVLFAELADGRGSGGVARAIAPFLAAPPMGAAAYAIFTLVRTSHLPDFRLLVEAPRLYASAGYMMVALPPWHPWLLVAAAYLLAVSSSVLRAARSQATRTDVLLLAVAVLGALLFAYYQGRSVDTNLPMVSYPAILIAAIAADRLLDRGEDAGLRHRAIGAVLLLGLAIGPAMLSIRARELLGTTRRAFAPADAQAPIRRTAEFLARYFPAGSEAPVLSRMSWYHHWATATRSPFRWAGLAELVRAADLAEIIDAVASRRFARVAVEPGFLHLPNRVRPELVASAEKALAEGYVLAATSPDGSLAIYERRPAGGSPAAP